MPPEDQATPLPAWRAELDAITGARAFGQFNQLLPRLKTLDEQHPNVPEIIFQLAWTCETLGRHTEALPAYEKALALGLAPNEHSGALLGLGNTLRALGQTGKAAHILRSGKHQFPDNREFDVFLALALHDQGHHAEALKLALETLCDTTSDPGLTACQRALRHAASKL
ncbi:MAG: tetratricopeptide repeat protein [Opitutales bacterium]